MLEKYKTIIYKSKKHEKAVINNCISCVQKYHPDCTKAEICDSIEKNKSDILNYDFTHELLMTEGKMLFDITVARLGNELWASNNLDFTNCEKSCPFGDMCNKYFVEIEDECICYGQMLHKQINMKSLQEIATERQVKIIKPNGETIVDLSVSDYNEELLSEYFFKYEWFIVWYGDNCEHGKRKVNGNNVISLL